MSYLALVRHGESEWNAKGLWTGWTDIGLTEKGRKEAKDAGQILEGKKFDLAFTSNLIRAEQTLDEIKKVLKQDISTEKTTALNERDYGDYTGKNKWQIKTQVGEEVFEKIRRGWDYPIPNGESLKDVYLRVVPFYEQYILPELKAGKNILISAHGNSLRALVKFLENIPDQEIANLEIATGEVYIYQIDQNGHILKKEMKSTSS